MKAKKSKIQIPTSHVAELYIYIERERDSKKWTLEKEGDYTVKSIASMLSVALNDFQQPLCESHLEV